MAMGKVCSSDTISQRTDGDGEEGRDGENTRTYRRRNVRIDRHVAQGSAHRPSRILRSQDGGNSCEQTWNKPTFDRMGENADVCREVHQRPSVRPRSPTVFERNGTCEPGVGAFVSRVQSTQIRPRVRFSERVEIFELNDWPADIYRQARKGPWMYMAVDRKRFERRIRHSEPILSRILTVEHRDIIRAMLIV